MRRRWIALAGGLYAVGVSVVTLGPSPAGLLYAATQRMGPFDFLSYGAVEALANVVLFVPVGALLCLVLPRLPRSVVWAACVLASVSVELAQTLLPDRVVSFRDVLTNSVGAGIGVLLHAVVVHRRRRSAT
jgi:glycopeptide antibiotics resistance protein